MCGFSLNGRCHRVTLYMMGKSNGCSRFVGPSASGQHKVSNQLIAGPYGCRHLKDIVYRERHASVAEFKSSIMRHVRCVTTEILNETVVHADLRFQHVVACGGSHIHQIM
ncbi:hypothetical protein TNCV_2782251 [Trichonephila clavipes]|nr:hypothetical protein TNCV_2782251 [Trichonephila clavipes]